MLLHVCSVRRMPSLRTTECTECRGEHGRMGASPCSIQHCCWCPCTSSKYTRTAPSPGSALITMVATTSKAYLDFECVDRASLKRRSGTITNSARELHRSRARDGLPFHRAQSHRARGGLQRRAQLRRHCRAAFEQRNCDGRVALRGARFRRACADRPLGELCAGRVSQWLEVHCSAVARGGLKDGTVNEAVRLRCRHPCTRAHDLLSSRVCSRTQLARRTGIQKPKAS